MSIFQDIGALCLLAGIIVFALFLEKQRTVAKNKNSSKITEVLTEKVKEYIRRRRQKWQWGTKFWFIMVISSSFLSLLNPANTIVVMVYFLLGVSTAMWLSRVVKDERVK